MIKTGRFTAMYRNMKSFRKSPSCSTMSNSQYLLRRIHNIRTFQNRMVKPSHFNIIANTRSICIWVLFLARGGVGCRRRREAQPSTANTSTFESERTDFGGQCGVGWWRPYLSAIPFTFAHICSRRQITLTLTHTHTHTVHACVAVFGQ